MHSISASGPDGEGAAATVAFLLSLRAKGIRDIALLRAMESVPRHVFAPPRCADLARSDVSLPLPCGQTMLSPATIASLLMALKPGKEHRVLEIGTGSGYVTALLAKLAREVVSLERYRSLAISAAERLDAVAAANASVMHGDGLAAARKSLGVFDRILLTGSVGGAAEGLLDLLAPDGRLTHVVRLEDGPRMIVITREADGAFTHETLGLLRLPPLSSGIAEAL